MARRLVPRVGWNKQLDVTRAVAEGFVSATHLGDSSYVRALDLGIAGRGESQAPPNCFEASATCSNYFYYLGRSMSLGAGKVIVLTGRLPRTPKTRSGEPVMSPGEARYWSLTGYYYGLSALFGRERGTANGGAVFSVMDDEVVTDANGWYIIALSRPFMPSNQFPG